jgi:hypothetical protein
LRRRRGRKKEKKRKKRKESESKELFFLVNWSYFTMGLLYWDLILEALSFYGKICLALFKKILGFKLKKIRPY